MICLERIYLSICSFFNIVYMYMYVRRWNESMTRNVVWDVVCLYVLSMIVLLFYLIMSNI